MVLSPLRGITSVSAAGVSRIAIPFIAFHSELMPLVNNLPHGGSLDGRLVLVVDEDSYSRTFRGPHQKAVSVSALLRSVIQYADDPIVFSIRVSHFSLWNH